MTGLRDVTFRKGIPRRFIFERQVCCASLPLRQTAKLKSDSLHGNHGRGVRYAAARFRLRWPRPRGAVAAAGAPRQLAFRSARAAARQGVPPAGCMHSCRSVLVETWQGRP